MNSWEWTNHMQALLSRWLESKWATSTQSWVFRWLLSSCIPPSQLRATQGLFILKQDLFHLYPTFLLSEDQSNLQFSTLPRTLWGRLGWQNVTDPKLSSKLPWQNRLLNLGLPVWHLTIPHWLFNLCNTFYYDQPNDSKLCASFQAYQDSRWMFQNLKWQKGRKHICQAVV